MNMEESQSSIVHWADATFGPASSLARVAARANEEMAELLRAVTAPVPDKAKAAEEAADIVIILFRLADICGEDLLSRVVAKMAINRRRMWALSKDGHGYHVRRNVET